MPTVAPAPAEPAAGAGPAPVGTLRDSLAFLRDPATFTAGPGRRLGDFYRLRLPAHDLRVVTDPELAEEILLTRAADFEKSRVYWRELRRIIGDSVASLEGDRWLALRRLEQPFFTPRRVRDGLERLGRVTGDELDGLLRRIGPGKVVPVLDVVSRLNTRLTLDFLFGRDIPEEERGEMTARIVDGEETIQWRSRFPWRALTGWLNGRNRRAAVHRRYFQGWADRLERTSEAEDGQRLLGTLRRLGRRDPPPYAPVLLRNELIVHLGASSETHGVAQGWCLYLLGRHPDVLARLRAEVDAVAGGGPVDAATLGALEYTTAVVRETLRLYPTAYGVVRDAVRPSELGGRPVRPGQVFFVSLVGLHRSPRNWPDPDRFDPERFLAGGLGEGSRFRYMPFGAGRHVCIGQHLALPLLVLGVAELARRFDWTFEDPVVHPRGLSTLKPRGAFRALLRPRAAARGD